MTKRKATGPRPKKRPYRTPRLRIYGDLKSLTKMKGGNRMDGGNPKTRTAGGM
jgi:hypothetical protein